MSVVSGGRQSINIVPEWPSTSYMLETVSTNLPTPDLTITAFGADTGGTPYGNNGSNFQTVVYANGLYWAFWLDNSRQYWWYVTSATGASWSASTLFFNTVSGLTGMNVVYIPGLNTLYFSIGNGSTETAYWRYGTPNSDGTITWSVPVQSYSIPALANSSIYLQGDVDADGNLWTTVFEAGGNLPIYKNGVLMTTIATGLALPVITLLRTDHLAIGPLFLLVQSDAGPAEEKAITVYWSSNGTSWNGPFNSNQDVYSFYYGGAAVKGGTVYYATQDYDTGYTWFLRYNTTSGFYETQVSTIGAGVSPWGTNISWVNGYLILAQFGELPSSGYYYYYSLDNGTTWAQGLFVAKGEWFGAATNVMLESDNLTVMTTFGTTIDNLLSVLLTLTVG
jgi:hypothetical protein